MGNCETTHIFASLTLIQPHDNCSHKWRSDNGFASWIPEYDIMVKKWEWYRIYWLYTLSHTPIKTQQTSICQAMSHFCRKSRSPRCQDRRFIDYRSNKAHTPVNPVPKPNKPGVWRFIQDLRQINAVNIPLPPLVSDVHSILTCITCTFYCGGFMLCLFLSTCAWRHTAVICIHT